jgi:IS1 family transposase
LYQLSLIKRSQIITLLAEGNSIRSTSRIVGVHADTVLRVLKVVGIACEQFHNEMVVDIESDEIQCDEIWSFIYAKDKNIPLALKSKRGIGDTWTWIGMDAKTKLIISWLSGKRDTQHAKKFTRQLSRKLKKKVQLTTDGYRPYLEAVEDAFHGRIDYAQILKIYKPTKNEHGDRKFSADTCVASNKRVIVGAPNAARISTSYIERQNLTVRMCSRRFTRDTNAFSKKFNYHCYALALQFVYYNFCRIHKTLRVTPAMEARIVDDILTADDLINMAYNAAKAA